MAHTGHHHTPVILLDEFLVAQEWAGMLQYTLGRQADFTRSGVLDAGGASRSDNSYRRSLVLYDLSGCENLFIDRITSYLPHVLARLHLPPFSISRYELQLTATNNNQFFKPHRDNDSDSVRTRELTFVYYFSREPRQFSCGALRLYDSQLDDSGEITAGPSQTIHPTQNQILFFPSECLHEVLPVECPSGEFQDSRFTVNGWIHR